MKKKMDRFKAFWKSQQKYFHEYEEEIANRNLELMQTVCFLGIAFCSIYYIGIKIFFESWSIPAYYILPVLVIFALFLLVINRKMKKRTADIKGTFVLVVLMYIFLLGITIVLSIFPNPDLPSIYYHMFIITCPVIFILPIYCHVILILVSYGVFVLGVLQFKVPEVWPHELFESFTAMVFFFIVTVLMLQFRLQSDFLKSKYFKLSQLDGLTNLLNKLAGIQISEQYLADLKDDEHFAVLFLDLDNFKHINDKYGHIKGDELLRTVSDILNVSCRTKDIICRFGGDEFLIVLKNIPSQEVALQRVKSIQNQINTISIRPIQKVTCSIGVYYIESLDDMNMKVILNKVDQALYQAKEKGKNCYHMVG